MDYPEPLVLAQQTQLNDVLVIEHLFHAHRSQVYRLALSILDDAAEADEATQDALLSAHRSLGTFRGAATFTTWLYSITVNVCRGRLRKRRASERLLGTLKALFWNREKTLQPEEQVMQNETDASLWRAVSELEEKYRLPVILRYYHDFSMGEIAQVLNTPEGTVRSRLHTARESLRVSLKGKLGSPWSQ